MHWLRSLLGKEVEQMRAWKTCGGATIALVALTLAIAGSGLAASERTVAAPTITTFSPKSGQPGTKVYITGTNLAGATVAFNGVQADHAAVHAAGTYVTAVVPTELDAGSSNPITVTTPGGMATTTAVFKVTFGGHRGVIAKPRILGFTPTHGQAGSPVKVA